MSTPITKAPALILEEIARTSGVECVALNGEYIAFPIHITLITLNHLDNEAKKQGMQLVGVLPNRNRTREQFELLVFFTRAK